MNIHLYTIVYNEEDIMPFFIEHYRKFVNKFIFYDNFSTDKSMEIVKNSGVDFEILTYESSDKQDDFIFTKIKNDAWKDSKNKGVDFVIVCDMDEFLYHEKINLFLEKCKEVNCGVVRPEGYNMYSETFPEQGKSITDQVKNGCRFDMLDKCVLFSPDKITEINYGMGCHTCEPMNEMGSVRPFKGNGLKLLHYKGLSLDYLLFKVHRSKGRVPEENRKKGIARHYFYSDEEYVTAFNDYLGKSTPII